MVRTLTGAVRVVLRDTECARQACPGERRIYRPHEEALLALPESSFGLDVVLEIGAKRIQDGWSFPRIHRYLQQERDMPIGAMTVQYLHRDYLALVQCQAATHDGVLRRQLRKQGAILPIIDGIQFGEGDAVLYLIIDALSRQPLFGQELVCRGAKELVPFIKQLKTLEIPILAVVSDKEKGLVPAVAEALPGTRHQYCQQHYMGNVAKKLEPELQTLGEEVRHTEEGLREFQRDLVRTQKKRAETGQAVAADLPVALELCLAARAEARRQARAPYQPPAWKRHEGLERVAQTANQAWRKKGGRGRTCAGSRNF
jgi:hypothetical protein